MVCPWVVPFTTVFVDTQLWITKHPRKRFQNSRQSWVLSTDRIEIHLSQPLVWPSDLPYAMLAGCDWWISIRSVHDNMYDWRINENGGKRVLLQMIFCSCVIGTTLSREKWLISSLSCQEVIKKKENKLGARMIELSSQNIVICQCLADQWFASVFGFGKWLICLPLRNHDILLVQ